MGVFADRSSHGTHQSRVQDEDNSHSPTRRPWQTKTLQAPSTLLDVVSLGIIFSELDRERPSTHESSKTILHC